MKIIYLVHQFFPEFQAGTEKFVYNMAYMAQKNGNKVKVISYSLANHNTFHHQSNGMLYKEFHYLGIPVLAYRDASGRCDSHIELTSEVNLNFALETLEQEKPDLIHVGHQIRVYPFIHAARKLNIPYIMTFTDFHLLCPKVILAPTSDTLCTGPKGGKNCNKLCNEFSPSFIRNRLNVARQIIQDASAIVVPSHFVANVFKEEIPGLEIHINNHGIRQSHIRINKRIYKENDKVVFGYIGNLATHKGVHVLLKAFAALDAQNAHLLIYGTGETTYMEKLKSLANNHSVTFMGTFKPEELSQVFDKVDVLVAPSICYETYSFVVHEALASEVVVICSNLGGMPEKINHPQNSFTFEAGNEQELKSIMKTILQDPRILNDVKTQISKTTLIPSIEQEAYQYGQLYQQCIV